MDYDQWEAAVPARKRADPLWRMRVYRLASFAADVGEEDCRTIARDPAKRDTAAQLTNALGSIPAHLAEGYSRSHGADRARLFEYALGSAREAREWYDRCTKVLRGEIIQQRTDVLSEVVRILLAIIPRERGRRITKQRTPPPE